MNFLDEYTRALQFAAFGAFCTLVALLIARATWAIAEPFIDSCGSGKERK